MTSGVFRYAFVVAMIGLGGYSVFGVVFCCAILLFLVVFCGYVLLVIFAGGVVKFVGFLYG